MSAKGVGFWFHCAHALTNAARRFARPITSYWCKSQDCESLRRSESPQLKIIVPGSSRFREKGLWTRWLGYWRTSLGFIRVCKIRVISKAYCTVKMMLLSVIESDCVWKFTFHALHHFVLLLNMLFIQPKKPMHLNRTLWVDNRS